MKKIIANHSRKQLAKEINILIILREACEKQNV